MKKIIISLILVICLTASFMIPSMAAVKSIEYDWEDFGLAYGGTDASLSGTGDAGVEVDNCRCNDSGGYKWLITGWATNKDAYFLFGDCDMSMVKSISLDYTMEKAAADYTAEGFAPTLLALAKKVVGDDSSVTFEPVASVIAEPTDIGGFKDVVSVDLEILDPTYNGPLYFYLDHGHGGTKNMKTRVANLVFTIDDGAPEATEEPIATPPSTEAPTDAPEVTDAPQAPTDAPATQAPGTATQAPTTDDEKGGCGSSSAVAQVMLILGVAIIIKKRK